MAADSISQVPTSALREGALPRHLGDTNWRARVIPTDRRSWMYASTPDLHAYEVRAVSRNGSGAVIVEEVVTQKECVAIATAIEEAISARGERFGRDGWHIDDEQTLREIFARAGVDLRERIAELLSRCWHGPVRVLADADWGSAGRGSFDRTRAAALRPDVSEPSSGAGKPRNEILTCTISLDSDDRDRGAVVVYRRPWEPRLAAARVPGQSAYAAVAVAGVPSVILRPCAGDMLIRNGRNLYEMLANGGEHTTFSLAVMLANDELVLPA